MAAIQTWRAGECQQIEHAHTAPTSALHEWLDNWSRWAAARHGQAAGHCVSVEHKYRAPRCFDEPAAGFVVDVPKAMRVEHAWRELPEPHRLALKLEWIKGLRRERQGSEARYLARMARSLGIAKAHVVEFLREAESLIARRLGVLA